MALLEKRLSMKFKNLTFDDTLLQSPRNISSVANLTPVAMAVDRSSSNASAGGSKAVGKDAKRYVRVGAFSLRLDIADPLSQPRRRKPLSRDNLWRQCRVATLQCQLSLPPVTHPKTN